MNIALFDAAKYWSGGAERVYLCAKGFLQEGHNVVVVCLPTSRLNKLLKDKIKVYNIHPVIDLDIFAAIKIFYVLIKHKIQIIDVHSPKFYWLCVFIGRLLNKKVFITRNVEYRKKGFKKRINRLLYYFCTGVITVSEKVRKDMMTDFNIKENKIKTIYDGFDFISYEIKSLRAKYSITNEVVLSIIGRIEENKGQDVAVEVAKKLVEKGYDIKMFIIGPVEEKNFYHAIVEKINKYQLSNKIIFTGFVTNVYDYIFSSDIILCCSKHEAMIKSVVESLVLKTPVVSTSVVKTEEIQFKNRQKFLYTVKDRNPESFVEVIESIVKNINFYRNQKIQKDYTIFAELSYLKMTRQYIDFYNLKR